MKIKYMFLFVLFLFVIPTVLSVKPVNIIQVNTGNLDIITPKNDFFPFNQPITLNFHIYNSTGHLLNNNSMGGTVCSLDIYNNSGADIFVNVSLLMNIPNTDFQITLSPSLFDKVGNYDYIIWCSNHLEGGFYSSLLTVSDIEGVVKDVETIDYETKKDIYTWGLGFILLLLSLFLMFFSVFDLATSEELGE